MNEMNNRYLEITYRHGKPVAAYFYLPRQSGDTSAKSVPGKAGLLTDFTDDGRPIGIEITSPASTTLSALNDALSAAHQPPATPDDIAPLLTTSARSSTAS
jgi:hypothetical protein